MHLHSYTYLQVLLLAMKDMNVAKLTAVDLPLFNGITSDLFPGVEVPQLDYGVVCLNFQTCNYYIHIDSDTFFAV